MIRLPVRLCGAVMQTSPRDRFGEALEEPANAAEPPPIHSNDMHSNDEFLSLLCGFRRSGGRARAHELSSILASPSTALGGLTPTDATGKWSMPSAAIHIGASGRPPGGHFISRARAQP